MDDPENDSSDSRIEDFPELPPNAFLKNDRAPDTEFYAVPRYVTHIDGNAIAAVMALYRELFPARGSVLDLMSSWISHLPREVTYAQVVGHGLNTEELAANGQLTSFFVKDLNADPQLPLESRSFDAAAICVSIQYLEAPIAVLAETARVLKPGGPVVISFSNRCFPTKAVAIWQALTDEAHLKLVGYFLEKAGFVGIEPRILVPKGQGFDPLFAVIGRTPT
jgi:SAM-dependent methyltransferase